MNMTTTKRKSAKEVNEARSDAAVKRHAQVGHTTADKTSVERKVQKEKQPQDGNGTYAFLVKHFENPSTIIDAATALAGHSKIDPQVAVRKVEQFLENAKLDQGLEVKAGTGANDGQFLIARVPQSAQRKETSVKATVKKTVTKKQKVSDEKHSQPTILIAALHTKPSTIQELATMLKKYYVDTAENILVRNVKWYLSSVRGLQRLGGKLIKTKGKHGESLFSLKNA